MRASRRSFLATAVGGSAAAVLLAGCGDQATEAKPPEDVTIAVTYRDGVLTPNAVKVEVAQGATVTVTVDSDAALHVHLHGYDQTIDASPGVPASLSFVADLVGTFELETHDPTKLVAQVVVRDAQ
ncbi:hypothetical protein IPV09_06085 [Tessaracoccus sp. SD287]|uniref:hypothetical protein n=1 Tax=Tessaracoccus sp. SD287 TaxID=2782008 RepID=UPI001A95BF72|nr:hypothetical protein [Tessaracoccus sp. SD287]MBO1030902.1 hypothetical protein [Tessaracoccus sp. SD287]